MVENRLYAYADDCTLLAIVRKPADIHGVTASLNMDLDRMQEWCNHWCMMLKPNKNKAFVVCRPRTLNTPHGDLIVCGVSIRTSHNIDILGMKLTVSSSSKTMCVVLFLVSLKELAFCVWWNVYMWIPVLFRWYYAFVLPILEYCSPVWGSAAECHLQLLGCKVYSVDIGFALIKVSCCCVIDVMLLYYVCCELHFCFSQSSTVDELRPQLIHWSLKYQGVKRFNLQGVSCPPRFVCGMTFPTQWLTPEC